MSDPFLGQIVMFGGNFTIRSWAKCDGQLLPIAQNTALFSILHTTYGGDGRTTYGLPDMRGRTPVHYGNGPGLSPQSLGSRGGVEQTAINVNNLPAHTHNTVLTLNLGLNAESGPGSSPNPSGNKIAVHPGPAFKPDDNDPTDDLAMAGSSIADNGSTCQVLSAGGQQPFSIMQPYTAVNFLIALQGIYPSRN